ncbi:uncharacterized protein LOC102719475 [Oryza brachyantha]|uniref:DUF1618 domain-containing protein n=1 Tax=Oryza brachyantha TaxID=4533 RepID=J3LLZ3_ORYBR|nr:uncharacterized protein LOC102719475 [Oryza brachyantha]
MAPAWVLLDRFVDLSPFDGQEEESEDMGESVPAGMRSVKADLQVADPPSVSSLSLLLPRKAMNEVRDAMLMCASKNLVVFYAGSYYPITSRPGCYLLYDAISNSLIPVPQLPSPNSVSSFGIGTSVVSLGGGGSAYVLAELLMIDGRKFPDAALFTWWSSAEATPRRYTTAHWVKEEVSLPHEVCTSDYYFVSDMTFSFGESCLCWVDLLIGIVVCDLLPSQDQPRFRFIPLPEGCSLDISSRRRPIMTVFRSVSCADGAIKFLTMEGYDEGWHAEEMKLTTWKLSPDLSEWKKGPVCGARDIWASEKYIAMGLSPISPMCPVLSVLDDDVVWVVMNDVDLVEYFEGEHRTIKIKTQYFLSIDMRLKQVLSITQLHPQTSIHPVLNLVACEFGAHLDRSKDRQGMVERNDADENTKKMKLK